MEAPVKDDDFSRTNGLLHFIQHKFIGCDEVLGRNRPFFLISLIKTALLEDFINGDIIGVQDLNKLLRDGRLADSKWSADDDEVGG